MLNKVWLGLFVLAFLSGLYQWLLGGNAGVMAEMVESTFDMARTSVDIAIGLTGLLAFWLGLFRIAEKAELNTFLARALAPLFERLMPEVPRGDKAIGSVTLNLGANLLGLDNAATPMGLKAMQDLQSLNPHKDQASNAQILFLVLNTSSITLLPVTIFLYRAQQGASEPASVFVPILLATSASTLGGLLLTSWIQKLKIWDPVVLAYAAGFATFLAGLMYYLVQLPPDLLGSQSSLIGNLVLMCVILAFLVAGHFFRVPVYEVFVEGAKEGFGTGIRLIPYLVAMLCAIGVFRASGCLDLVLAGLGWLVGALGLDTDFVAALPTALMKPFSGSGARAMLIETMENYGVDSFPALVAATVQGSTETTFYVLAVYFGSVGVRKVRHAIVCGLFADVCGIVAAILAAYWFFH
jgi:spore maturation protein SpmA